jgi:hypothetical protein
MKRITRVGLLLPHPGNTSPQMSRIMRGSAILRQRLSLIVQDNGRHPVGG